MFNILLSGIALIIFVLLSAYAQLFGRVPAHHGIQKIDSLISNHQNLQHRLDILEKKIDNVLWYQRTGGTAYIDKVYLTGPPLRKGKILNMKFIRTVPAAILSIEWIPGRRNKSA